MKSALAIIFAVILTALGIGIVVLNVHTLTTPLLVAAGASIGLAMALAIPAKLENALLLVERFRKAVPPNPAVVDDAEKP